MTARRNGDNRSALAKKTATIKLNGDYKGFEVTIWLNPPFGLWKKAGAQEIDNFGLMAELIVDWNLVDYDGNALPSPTDSNGFDALPIDLMQQIDQALTTKMQEVTQVPKANAKE